MTAIIWKELRELIKWAALAMLAMGAAQVHALYSMPNGMDFYHNDGISLCRASFLLLTTFGYPATGIFFGLIQILPELKRDRWAALLHRPVPRTSVLFGKIAAGLILYLIAAGVPFLFSLWLAATPGHLNTPFVPGQALAGLADLCAGLVYYFAALLLGLQAGGWPGLRVFPLLAAAHVTYFILDTKYFFVAVEAMALMAVALAVAAWGAINHPRSLGDRPFLAKAAFLAVVFYGACGLGDLGISLLQAFAPPSEGKFTRYAIARDGTPFAITYQDQSVVAVTDLQGRAPTDPRYTPGRVRGNTDDPNTTCGYVGSSHGWRPWSYLQSYRNSTKYLWSYFPYTYPRLEQWFYLREQGVLLGFQPNIKRAFGFLDRRGFQSLSSIPEPFTSRDEINERPGDLLIWSNPKGLRFVRLSSRTITPAPLPEPPPIFGTSNTWATSDTGVSIQVLAAAFTSGMAVYDDKPSLAAFLPYHRDTDRWGNLSLAITPALDRFFLWYQPSVWIDNKTKSRMPSYLDVMDKDGRVLQSFTLPPLPPDPPRPLAWKTFFERRLQGPAFFAGTMAWQKIGAEFGIKRLEGALRWQFGSGWAVTKEIAAWTGGISFLLAICTLAIARRAHLSRRRAWAWAGFVFCLNLPGFLTFLLAADWPLLVPCFRCHRPRVASAGDCPHCRSGWPAQESSGTEIFENLPKPAGTTSH
jgi:hypothetical protein